MNKSTIKAYLAVIAIGLILFTACAEDEPLEPLRVGSNPDLAAHSAEFNQEVQNKLHIGMMKLKDKAVVHAVTLDGIFSGMAVNLNPQKSADVDTVAGFRFPDTGEAFTVHVRRGVAEIRPQFPENPDISLTVDSSLWKEVATGFRNPAIALVKDVDKEGGTLEIVKFLKLFDDD